MRLILHTVAYWMLWDVQDAMPKAAGLKRAEFATIQRRLVKIGARVMETATRIRIAFASDWIEAATDYDVESTRADPPRIGFCETGDAIPYESGTVLVDDTLNGAYDWPNRRVILVHPWDPNTPQGRSVLLHELIHHVQLANRGFECVNAPEWGAYKLQDAYLTEHGVASG